MYELGIEPLIKLTLIITQKRQKNYCIINVQNPFLCFFFNQWTLSVVLPAIDLSDLRL